MYEFVKLVAAVFQPFSGWAPGGGCGSSPPDDDDPGS